MLALPPFVLSLVLAFAVASPPAVVPRLVVSLREASAAKVVVRVENAGHQPLVLGARTYLVLLKGSQGADSPAYWAEVDNPRLPTLSTPMRLAAKHTADVTLDLGSLLWSPDRSGVGPGQTLARGVPPGEYELQVRIVDEREAWWRSGDMPIKVSRGGGITGQRR
jgi:hypothetical protein